MVSWQVLGEQAVRLSVGDIAPQGLRQRLALLWKIVRSLFVWGRSPEPESAEQPELGKRSWPPFFEATTKQVDHMKPQKSLSFQESIRD